MLRRLTDADRSAIVDRYTRGQGIDWIAYAMDLGRITVRRVLVAAGVKIRKPGKNKPGDSWGWTGMS